MNWCFCMDLPTISEILIRRGRKICPSRDIRSLFGNRYLAVLSRLINAGWLLPIKGMRGIYYVRDPDERLKKFRKLDSLEIAIRVLNLVLGKEWYFGRITALSLSGSIEQDVSVYYILNKKLSRKISSEIFGKMVFVKTGARMGKSCAIMAKKHRGLGYRVCAPERNAADYIYAHVHGHAGKEQIRRFCRTYSVSKLALVAVISGCFPQKSAKKMLAVANGAVK